MTKLLQNLPIPALSIKNILSLLIFYCAIALIFAYISQYFFNHQPCLLCIYQRWAFFLIIFFAIFGLFVKQNFGKASFFICLILIFGNFLLASYHSGVELKIFQGPKSCSGNFNLKNINSASQLEDQIKNSKITDCRNPSFVFLGLSMAMWNAIYCFILFFASLKLYKKWH